MISRLTGLAPILLLAVASPAAALVRPVPNPGPVVPPTVTPAGPDCNQPPSAATCQDATYLSTCAAAKDPANGCGPILTGIYSAQYAAQKTQQNTKPVLLPAAMMQQTAPGAYLGTVYNDALAIPASPVSIVNPGVGGTGDFLESLDFYRTHPFSTPRFAQGDQTMRSCAEYAWKKWGMYSWFLDVARGYGNDYASVLQAATDPAQPYNIVTSPVRWDGQPVSVNGLSHQYNFKFATNAFFYYDFGPSSTNPTLTAIHNAIIKANPQTQYPNWTQLAPDNDYSFSPRVLAQHRAAGITDAHYVQGATRAAAYYVAISDAIDKAGEAQALADELNVDAETGGRTKLPPGARNAIIKASKAASEAATAAFAKAQDLLVAEWDYDADHGCLGRTFNGHPIDANYCDWSPQQAVDAYRTHAFMSGPDYQRCIEDTGDDFTVMTSHAAQQKVWTDPNFYQRDNSGNPVIYNDSLADIEDRWGTDRMGKRIKTDFFDAYEHREEINAAEEQYQRLEIESFRIATQDLPLKGPAGSPTAIGSESTDHNEIGGDWFGARYSYTTGWTLTPHNEQEFGIVSDPAYSKVCRIDGEIHGSLTGDALLLKSSVSLVNASFKASTGPGKVSVDYARVNVLGNDLYNQSNVDITAQGFDLPIDSTPAQPKFSTIIPLLGIPITVTAGAALHVGVESKLQAAPPRTCDAKNLTVSLVGAITPSVRVDGFASAGVDLGVISAGIEGDLTLLKVAVPLTTKVSLATESNGDFDILIDTNADLALTELAGHVDLYAEVNVGFWSNRSQMTLFSWDGLHQSTNLFHRAKQYPVPALDYVFFGQVKP